MPLTPDEQKELAALEQQAGATNAQAATTPGGLTPDEQKELAQLEATHGGAAPNQGLGHRAMDLVRRGLDYTSGIGRTVAAGTVGELMTDKNLASQKDFTDALKGNAPSTAQYLERAGVPEGYHVSDALPVYADKGKGAMWQMEKGGRLDPSLRGIAGFAGDVALDPATYLTMGASAAAKTAVKEGTEAALKRAAQMELLQKVANPVGTLLEAGGKKLYKSGLTAVDRMAEKFGKDAPSELLFKEGVTGSANSIAKQAATLSDQLLEKRNNLLAAADAAGGKVDVSRALAPVDETLNKLRMAQSNNPIKDQIATTLDEQIAPFRQMQKNISPPAGSFDVPMRPVSPTQGSDIKSSIYEMIGPSAFEQARSTPTGKAALQDLGRGWKEAVENSVENSIGKGKELAGINSDMGNLLTTRKAFTNEATKEGNKNALTSVDGILLGLGNPAAFATKKAADILKLPLARTKAGKALYDAGKYDPAIRRFLVNASRDDTETGQH